jgi:hypothetical protein
MFVGLKCNIAPYLILAGDIGDPNSEIFKEFIKWCHQNWKNIFYVAGNHEYFGYYKEEAEEKLASALNFKNVYWLKANSETLIDIPNSNYSICGCTLWSCVSDDDMSEAQQYISNYRKIWKNSNKTENTMFG